MKNKAAQELGRLGGPATFKKYKKKHYSEMGKKSGESRRNRKLPIDPIEIILKK